MELVTRPRPEVAFVLAGVMLLGTGLFVALAPVPATYAVLAAGALAVALRFPKAMVLGFAVVEPFQNLLLRVLPSEARYFDEIVVLGLVVAVVVPALVRRPSRFLADPLVAVLGLFLAAGLLSGRLAGAPLDRTFAGLFVTVDYVLLYLVLRTQPPPAGTAKALIQLVVWLGVLATAVAVVQHLFPHTLVASWQHALVEGGLARMPSLFRHPNAFGYFMLAATFLAVATAVTLRSQSYGILAAICGAGVFLSVSRSAGVALFVGLIVGGIVANRRLLRVAVLLALLATTVMAPFFVRGVESRIHKMRVEGGDARITYVMESLPILRSRWLLGVGPGSFGGEVAHRLGSKTYARYHIRFDSRWTTVDDFWLHLVVESGVVGLGLFLLLLWCLFRRALTGLRRPVADPYDRALLLAVPMLVAGLCLIDLTSMAFEANQTAGLFWLVCGVAAAGAGDVLPSTAAPEPDGPALGTKVGAVP